MKIEVLVGMIASGKSTYARARARDGALVVSHDDLTEMLHGEYRYEQGLRDCYRMMEEDLVRSAIRFGRDAVIDRTHLTRESRRRWIDFANDNNAGSSVVAVVFPVEAATTHAIRRNQSDTRGRSYAEWSVVATHHHDQAKKEPVGAHEGFSRIVYRPSMITSEERP